MHHHCAVGNIVVRLVPHRLINDLNGKDALRVLHEQPQNFVFRLGQIHFPLVHPHTVAVQCKAHTVQLQRGVVRLVMHLILALIHAVPAQQRLDPRAQLRKGERLCQIVVASRRQAQQLVRLLRFCGTWSADTTLVIPRLFFCVLIAFFCP